MTHPRLTPCGCATLAAAALFVVLAASIGEAQTATKEQKQEDAIVNEEHMSSCTGETARVNGRRETRTRTRDEQNKMRIENRVKEWAKGKALTSTNQYNWNRDAVSESRSSERTFKLLFRERTRFICEGSCLSLPGQGDDEFFSTRDCIDVKDGVARPCKSEPPTTECK